MSAAARRETRTKPRGTERPAWGKLVAASLILAGLALAWHFTPLSEFLTLERIRGWARAMADTSWAPYALAGAYTPAALLLFPRQIITLLLLIAFGTWVALACSVTGVMIAALVLYCTGRFVPYSALKRLLGSKLDVARELFREHGVMSIFALDMLPVPPFAVQAIVAGSMRVKLWEYGLGTLLSLVPGAVVIVFFGHEVSALMGEDREANLWMLAAALVAVIVTGLVMRRWAQKRLAGPGR
jgi:phospholipase D1/2